MSVCVTALAVRGFLARCPWPMRQRGPGAGRCGSGGRREGAGERTAAGRLKSYGGVQLERTR